MFLQLLANKHHRLRDFKAPITIWPSGGLRLVTDKKKTTKNNNKSRAEQEPRSPMAARLKNITQRSFEPGLSDYQTGIIPTRLTRCQLVLNLREEPIMELTCATTYVKQLYSKSEEKCILCACWSF